MNTYAVLGLGMIGKAITHDLLVFDTDATVLAFDISEDARESTKNRFETFGDRLKIYDLDLQLDQKIEENSLFSILRENKVKVTFGAIDYKFNRYLSELCILVGSSYLDLGGNPEMVRAQRELDERAKSAGVTIVPDCGLAPGMANVVAAHGLSLFDELDECHIRVGGLPQQPKTILNYQQVFSIRGLTNEYLEDCYVIRDGKVITVPSLTEVEHLGFPEPFSDLEAFQTSGGTSNLPDMFEGKVKELTYKTIRYSGHVQFIKFLKEFGLLSSESYPKSNDPSVNPRSLVEYYLEQNLPRLEPDVVLMRVAVTGLLEGVKKLKQWTMIDKYDELTDFSSMARTTAYPTTIIGMMIAQDIIKEKGVVFGEAVTPKEHFIEELSKRNILLEYVEKDL